MSDALIFWTGQVDVNFQLVRSEQSLTRCCTSNSNPCMSQPMASPAIQINLTAQVFYLPEKLPQGLTFRFIS